MPKSGTRPKNPPISKWGLTTKQLSKLTPAVRKLTGKDLNALRTWWKTRGAKVGTVGRLTITDLHSLRNAYFSDRDAFNNSAMGKSCCTCGCRNRDPRHRDLFEGVETDSRGEL